MKNLYLDTRVLDERASEKFDLSEELLMENAAAGIANFIRKKFKKGDRVLGICGGGNNGADVLCTLRMLEGEFELTADERDGAKSLYLSKKARSR